MTSAKVTKQVFVSNYEATKRKKKNWSRFALRDGETKHGHRQNVRSPSKPGAGVKTYNIKEGSCRNMTNMNFT